MSDLAKQAGDWTDHLPFEVAVAYLDSTEFQRDYGPHVDDCRYCSDLIDALHPTERTLDRLIRTVRDIASVEERDAATALTEAWSSVNTVSELMLKQQGTFDGSLRTLTTAQKRLAEAHALLNGPRSIAPMAWSGTVALSLDPYTGPGLRPVVDHGFATTIEEVASHLLSFGFRIAYSDDLQPVGPSERLFNLACQYGLRMPANAPPRHAHTVHNAGLGVEGYCAWPVHIGMPVETFEASAANFERFDSINCLSLDGEPHSYTYFSNQVRHEPEPQEWMDGMAALRNTIGGHTLARIAIGGATTPIDGSVPTVAQDALASLEDEQPLYVLGGFGGCAQDIAMALQLTATATTEPKTSGLEHFAPFARPQSLHNGLDAAENQSLAATVDVEEAMGLVLRGLSRIAAREAAV